MNGAIMKKLIYIIPVFLLLFYTGCTDNSTNPTNNQGQLKISMVDSPAQYDQVNIVVSRVEVHMADSSESSWMIINPVPHTYDLLQLRNGASVVLGDTFLTAGHYTQIRLILGEGSNVVINGDTIPLVIPSGFQTGVKLNHEFDIMPGNLYELMLDFNADRSIHITGNGVYMMNPVIRVMPVVTSGTISGQVLPLDADANVWTLAGTDTVSTSPNSGGYFSLMMLPAGTYDVHIEPNNIAYVDSIVTNVSVTAGNNTDIGIITLR
jgi:hypothetical protein